MAVLTICNHGTGFNRVKGPDNGELVGWVHTNITGDECRMVNGEIQVGNYIVNDGPGSSTGGVSLPSAVNPTTGRRKKDERITGNPSSFGKSFLGHSGKHGTGKLAGASGNISGTGWDENIHKTVHLIQTLIFDNLYDVTHINMVGWSRGGVTCMRIANKLYEVLGDRLTVNIFAADPVAGQDAGKKLQDTRTIPPIVRNYVAVLAKNEMRKTFKPQDMSRMQVADQSRTQVVYLPMPGQHNAQVMPKSGVNGSPEASITHNLAFAFLRHFGTPFEAVPNTYINSNALMCRYYGRAINGSAQYRDSSGIASRVVGMGLGRRSFAKTANMNQYVSGGKTSYWINEHHRYCFANAFPNTFNAIFTRGIPGRTMSAVQPGELAGMGGTQGVITRSLMGKGFLVNHHGRVQAVCGAGVPQHYAIGNRWLAHLPSHG